MTTTIDHFGNGSRPEEFTPRTLDSLGKLRACVGHGNIAPNRSWYGVKIPSDNISNCKSNHIYTVCEYCAVHGFSMDELYEITDTTNTMCECFNTKKMCKIVGDRRTIRYNGIKLNGNLVDVSDTIWSPIIRIRSDKELLAASAGVLLLPVPSGSWWEFVVQCDDEGKYYSEDYYFKIRAIGGDGREIVVSDQTGSTNFYTPCCIFTGDKYCSGHIKVNAYRSGQGQRFFFQAPAKIEEDNGITANHNLESNKIYITVTVHTKNMINEDIVSQYRGGNEYSGGSNFGANGYSKSVSTLSVTARFPLVDTINMTLQLVNNESDNERRYVANKLQQQDNQWILNEIVRLQSGTSRSKVLCHGEQSKYLV